MQARSALETGRFRRAAADEVDRINDSYTTLSGVSTDWGASFLRDEWRPDSHASLLVSRDPTGRTFYLFDDDKLWKLYVAFDALVFPEGNFDAFGAMLQRRFGPAKRGRGESSLGTQRHWLEWQDGETRLRSVDQTNTYGFYCLVFEDKHRASP